MPRCDPKLLFAIVSGILQQSTSLSKVVFSWPNPGLSPNDVYTMKQFDDVVQCSILLHALCSIDTERLIR
ncbi:MAG: hypothetical protein ACJAVI_001404 [Candidatus Azotimanducaceae bacterium]|jgi:hypothetical protein